MTGQTQVCAVAQYLVEQLGYLSGVAAKRGAAEGSCCELMIEVGQFFELRLSALKEEGQPKLATLFAFGCEPVTICAVGTILPVATVSPFLSAEETFQVK